MITSVSLLALLFFVYFSFIYELVSFVIVNKNLPTSSVTILINLITDVCRGDNCACLAVFDSSLIIPNKAICEPKVLICS